MTKTLAIIADFNASKSHLATNEAIAHSTASLGLAVEPRWIDTSQLAQPQALKQLREFAGFWIGPGSPYANMEGALSAIRIARESGIPLLGTCGGFQHIIIEYARNVLGFADAEHEESSPNASRLFISRLACSLVGRTMALTLNPDSMLADHRSGGISLQLRRQPGLRGDLAFERIERCRIRRGGSRARRRIARPSIFRRYIVFAPTPFGCGDAASARVRLYQGLCQIVGVEVTRLWLRDGIQRSGVR
jgi:CTP synthase (UTP-ammonia lyase)